MGETRYRVVAPPQRRRKRLDPIVVGLGLLLAITFVGCSRETEVKVPGYLKDADGNLVELSPQEIETLSKEAEELNAKREAEKQRSANR